VHSDLTHEAIAVADQEFICRPREAWERRNWTAEQILQTLIRNQADCERDRWLPAIRVAWPRTIRVAGATQLFGADLLSSRTFNSVAERCRAQGPVIACRGLRAATSGTGRSGGQRMAGRQRTCSECRASDLAIYIERQ